MFSSLDIDVVMHTLESVLHMSFVVCDFLLAGCLAICVSCEGGQKSGQTESGAMLRMWQFRLTFFIWCCLRSRSGRLGLPARI